jgi:hypothetical protein
MHAFTQDAQRPSSLHPSSIIWPVAQSWTAQTGSFLPRGDLRCRQPHTSSAKANARTKRVPSFRRCCLGVIAFTLASLEARFGEPSRRSP